MKLESCFINGFGCLTDFQYDFSENTTCILEKNGFGKTTLSAFLCAMFYGLKTARKNSTDSERDSYYPWSGSVFGGEIIFSVGERRYRAIRRFDRSSNKKDTFELYDFSTGAASTAYSDNLGEELFSVDEEGFRRTTYFSGTPDFSALPGSVHSGIGSSVECADDLADADQAVINLNKSISELEGRGKLIGKTESEIRETEIELEETVRKINAYHDLRDQYVLAQKQAEKEEENLAQLQRRYHDCLAAEAYRVKKETRDRNAEKLDNAQKELALLLQLYKCDVPDENTVLKIRALYDEISKTENRIELIREELNTNELKEIRARFANSDLSQNEWDKQRENRDAVLADRAAIKRLEDEISALGEDPLPDNAPVAAEEMISAVRAVLSKKETEKPVRKKTWPVVIPAIGIVLGVVGAILLRESIPQMVTALSASGLCLAALISICISRAILKQTQTKSADEQTASLFRMMYGFSADYPLSEALETVLSHQKIREKKDMLESARQQYHAPDGALSSLGAFCAKFGYAENDPVAVFEKTESEYRTYRDRILTRSETLQTAEEEQKRQSEEIVGTLSAIFVTVPQDTPDAMTDRILSDRSRKEILEREIAELSEQIRTFDEQQTEFVPRGTASEWEEKCDAAEIRLRALRDELIKTESNLQNLPALEEKETELKDKLESDRETLREYRKKAELLTLTRTYLTGAKDTLLSRYSEGVKTNFETFIKPFAATPLADCSVSYDLLPTFRPEGIDRGVRSLSSGLGRVADLVIRASLIMTMYEGEKPFLILDDPFTELDAENLKYAKELLFTLSEKLQIVYLTCHESRLLNN